MKFNRFLWNLYRDSKEGRIAIERDVSGHLAAVPKFGQTPSFQMFFYEESGGEAVENGISGVEEVDLRGMIGAYAAEHTVATLDDAEQLFTEMADDGVEWPFTAKGKSFVRVFAGGQIDPAGYGDVFGSIDHISAGLHDAHPEFFVPYFFARRFDEFCKICECFDILLPEIPGKLQKRERALYYVAINRALYEFRKHYRLSPKELNAFLYDFAPKNLTLHADNQLPLPSRVWFVIGGVGNNDFEYLDATSEKSVSYWQGSLETRRGDIILMWCASPRSYLHSIWRALDNGFNDPFFYYYSVIRVGHPIRITPIPFKEFLNHPVLGQKSAVRAHFQGASGTPFSTEEYAAICDLLSSLGFDPSLLPPAPAREEFYEVTLENERDVEQMLVEPLLKRLGFEEHDWFRQFSVRMGRGERNFPDYVLGGDPRPGEEKAVAVIECKFDIPAKKDLREAFIQAKSYALRLQSEVMAIAARRGLWVFRRRDDGFSLDHFTFKTWKELSHPDVLHEVSLTLGKRAIDTWMAKRHNFRKKTTRNPSQMPVTQATLKG
uniref:Type I restriction enzyme R protein N-terminal domain-containing protein n=1 Tax=Desulfatirhabdium butyrativorans TaxID=340467 RepID=A0A7C4RSJ7_9BACT